MSLTLVGHAFSCLVAHSPRARLSAAWRARAAPDRAECGVGLQQSSDRLIFPLAGDVFSNERGCLRMGSRARVNRCDLTVSSKRPGRNLFAQGATKRIARRRWTTGGT
jgi:hypothetical protein